MPQWFQGQRRLAGSTGIKNYGPAKKKFTELFHWYKGQALKRQIGIGAALYFFVAILAYAAFHGNACAVILDRQVVAVAASEKDARSALKELADIKSGQTGIPVVLADKVSFEDIRVKTEDIPDKDALLGRLDGALTFKAKAAAIMVDGQEKVALKDKGDAEKLLDWLRTAFPLQQGEQVGFKEKVEVAYLPVDAKDIVDLETARQTLLCGSNRVQQYTIKDGDTLWDIERATNIDLGRMLVANPGIDPDCLSIGQVLNLSEDAPIITVVATRDVTVDEEVPYPVEAKIDDSLLLGEKRVIRDGENGERNITYRIVRENGLETDREVLAERVIREAVPAIIAKGSYTMLASRGGSGRLDWPCWGGVVSNYGMRDGRMHEGVDLGANYGSPITAAAGGKVISAGWEGGYGKLVQISHGGGMVTYYAHLSTILVDVGQYVDRGEVIGKAGATGYATGPHLHFEVRIDGEPRSPLNYLQ